MMLELKNVEEIHLHSMALNEADKLSFQSMDLPMLKSLEVQFYLIIPRFILFA